MPWPPRSITPGEVLNLKCVKPGVAIIGLMARILVRLSSASVNSDWKEIPRWRLHHPVDRFCSLVSVRRVRQSLNNDLTSFGYIEFQQQAYTKTP
ncbi:hypothetical protein RRG08_043796 [Elysia crispata]|uniref:Uncharacterized protein n=1 Tax=Elysia crispata TaxID=231223 RepID=A0AAE1D9R1_9GAST|nr:hypothetical protein RRG08_043796 [Elysia crispata]